MEAWLTSTAEAFWQALGGTPAYPRDVRYAISYAFPISVIALPNLCVRSVERWLQRSHIPFRFLCENRSLCGCIVAVRGNGLIFVDCHDAEDEQRYTITHETAHFLLDYLYPRKQVLNLFGESILPVLDGDRAPTEEEQVDAVLCGVRLGLYSDLMPRSVRGELDQSLILRAEQKADRLALELLAPAEQVLSELSSLVSTANEEGLQPALQHLCLVYGLPLPVAKKYCPLLLHPYVRPSMAQWLGL